VAAEVQPLEAECARKKAARIEALRDAVPRDELARKVQQRLHSRRITAITQRSF